MFRKLIIIVVGLCFTSFVFANNEQVKNKINNENKNIHIIIKNGKKELLNEDVNVDNKYQQLKFSETTNSERPNRCLTSNYTLELILIKEDLKITLSKSNTLNYQMSCLTKEEQEYMALNGYRIPPKLTELLKSKTIVKNFSNMNNGELKLTNDNVILKWNYID